MLDNNELAPKTNKMKKLLIKGAHVWHLGKFSKLDVLIANGVVEAIANQITPTQDARVVEAEGYHLLPGLVDMHVHLRTPGYEYKENMTSGTAAAAHGGFTTVCSMPNLQPAPDSVDNLKVQQQLIDEQALVEVLPYATITLQRKGSKCVNFAELAPMVAGFSDDGTGVQDGEVMRKAMEQIAPTGALLAAHCEVESLLNGGYIHDGDYAKAHGHKGISSQSEWQEVQRDIELAEQTGCRLHICHISTAESVEAVRQGKARGVKVTCEVAPHYLALCDEDLKEEGRYKMNPPLRSRSDMEALRQGIKDGTIDVIATDHAPHTAEEKSKGLAGSAMGVVGLETSLPAVYSFMVCGGVISLERMVEMMADKPRELLGIKGGLKVGERADVALINFAKENRVDTRLFRSKGIATPFDKMRLHGKVLMTVAAGKVVYEH